VAILSSAISAQEFLCLLLLARNILQQPASCLRLSHICQAAENGEGILDKEVTSHDDLFDSFRFALMFW